MRAQRADPGDRGQAAHRGLGPRRRDDAPLEQDHGNRQAVDLLHQEMQHLPQQCRYRRAAVGDNRRQLGKPPVALCRDNAELGQLAAHVVHQLGVLPHQQIARAFERA